MAVALAAYSAYQGMQAQEAASDQAEKQNKMNEENLAFARQRYSENKARRDKEEELFRPIKERVIGEAQSDKPAGWDKQANIINQGYGDVIRRASAGNQNSGLGASMVQGANLGKTSSLASAYADAKEKQRLSLTSLMGTGMQSAQSMTGDVNQSGRDQSTQMGNMANAYGANAAGLGQAASNAYSNAITGVGRAWAGGEFGKIGDALSSGYGAVKDWFNPTEASTSAYMPNGPIQPIEPRSELSTYGMNLPKTTDTLSERPLPYGIGLPGSKR